MVVKSLLLRLLKEPKRGLSEIIMMVRIDVKGRITAFLANEPLGKYEPVGLQTDSPSFNFLCEGLDLVEWDLSEAYDVEKMPIVIANEIIEETIGIRGLKSSLC